MTSEKIIETLIINRENTLSVKRIQVNLTPGSMGNPNISVGTLPYYEWSKEKELSYVITYGRYLSCEMLVYPKLRDKDFIEVKGQAAAITELNKIINRIANQ